MANMLTWIRNTSLFKLAADEGTRSRVKSAIKARMTPQMIVTLTGGAVVGAPTALWLGFGLRGLEIGVLVGLIAGNLTQKYTRRFFPLDPPFTPANYLQIPDNPDDKKYLAYEKKYWASKQPYRTPRWVLLAGGALVVALAYNVSSNYAAGSNSSQISLPPDHSDPVITQPAGQSPSATSATGSNSSQPSPPTDHSNPVIQQPASASPALIPGASAPPPAALHDAARAATAVLATGPATDNGSAPRPTGTLQIPVPPAVVVAQNSAQAYPPDHELDASPPVPAPTADTPTASAAGPYPPDALEATKPPAQAAHGASPADTTADKPYPEDKNAQAGTTAESPVIEWHIQNFSTAHQTTTVATYSATNERTNDVFDLLKGAKIIVFGGAKLDGDPTVYCAVHVQKPAAGQKDSPTRNDIVIINSDAFVPGTCTPH